MGFFRKIGLALALLSMPGLAWAQTATLLPNAIQQYFDNNGKVLANGKVYYYIPNTLTPKTVWTTSDESVPQPQPVPLGISGRPGNPIYGDGSYRQIVQDQFNNVIWDYTTASTGGGSSGGGTPSSEGVMVGTIIPWVNTTLPNRYLYTAGQAISRTTYSVLLTAITYNTTILCAAGIATINVSTTISDSTPIGAPVEFSCFAPGTTVISKASGQLTLSSNATATASVNGNIFPWGNGDGSTTFNVPDLRGRVLVGRDNMNSVVASRLSAGIYGSNPDANNAAGGAQSFTMSTGYMAAHSHFNTLTDPGHAHTEQAAGGGGVSNNIVSAAGNNATNAAVQGTTVNTTGITITNGTTGGGIAVSAAVVAGGSGYTNGTQLLTLSGGTCTTNPQFNVTVSGGVVSAPTLATAGSCTVPPTNPAATTGGGGTGATLNVNYSPLPIGLVQPSLTADYIIKVLPDDSPTGPGVSSIGGMTGAISCGTNVTCTANSISVTIVPASFGNQVANTVLAGPNTGSPANPSFRNLVNADLPVVGVPNGGTGLSSGTANGVPYFNSSTTMLSTAAGTATQVLHGGATPAFSAVSLSTDVTGVLPYANLPTGTLDTALGYWGSTTLSALAINNCANALTYSTSTHTFGCNTTAGTGTVTSVTCFGTAITSTGTCTVAATKSDQQTATNTTAVVTPSQQQSHPSAIKVSANFVGSGCSGTCTLNHGYNVSSVTRSSTGVFVVNFTTPFTATTAFECTGGQNNVVTQQIVNTSVSSVTMTFLGTTSLVSTDPGVGYLHCTGTQ